MGVETQDHSLTAVSYNYIIAPSGRYLSCFRDLEDAPIITQGEP